MNLAIVLYCALKTCRPRSYALSDALLVLFLHDLEKPWKSEIKFGSKDERREFRELAMILYGIVLTPEQANALRYVEGEGDDYTNEHRVMGPLAAFCHACDVISARDMHDHPLAKADPWIGAHRHSE